MSKGYVPRRVELAPSDSDNPAFSQSGEVANRGRRAELPEGTEWSDRPDFDRAAGDHWADSVADRVDPVPAPPTLPAGAEWACRAEVLTKIYGVGTGHEVKAVDEVSVAFPRGTMTAIMGPSGSGKSTLMHCLAGLDSVTSGQVFLGDTELTSLNDSDLTALRRDQIGFIFQAFNLLPALTAEQNVVLPLELAGRRPDTARIGAVIESLGIGPRLKHRPAELSGGQQQRVAVARALVTEPTVIFADEPTGALDSRTGQALLTYLQRCAREEGQTIVMVTHDPLAASYADRAVVLNDGRVVDDIERPTPESVLAALGALEAAVVAQTSA